MSRFEDVSNERRWGIDVDAGRAGPGVMPLILKVILSTLCVVPVLGICIGWMELEVLRH